MKVSTVKDKRPRRHPGAGGLAASPVSRSSRYRSERLARRRRARQRRLTLYILLAGFAVSAAAFAAIFLLARSRAASQAPLPAAGGGGNVIVTGAGADGKPSQILLMSPGSQGGYSIYTLPVRTVADAPGHGFQLLGAVAGLGGQPLLDQTVANLLGTPIRYHLSFDWSVVEFLAAQAGSVDFKTDRPVSSADGSINLATGDNNKDGQEAVSWLNAAVSDGNAGPRIQALFYRGLHDAIMARTEAERRRLARELYRRVRTDMSEDDFTALFMAMTEPGRPFGVWPLPVRQAGSGASWYLEPLPDELRALMSGSPENSTFTLEVRGAGDRELADAVAARLAPLRFTMMPGNGQSGAGFDNTQIRCGSDAIGPGNQIHDLLGKGIVIKDDTLQKRQIIVIIGSDLSLPDLQKQ